MALKASVKKGLKTVGIVAALSVGFGGLRYAAQHGYGHKYLPQFVTGKVDLDNVADSSKGTAKEFLGLPSKTPANLPNAPHVRVKLWAWEAQSGCEYANGGVVTTAGSLMAAQNINMTIERQDKNELLQADLIALADALHSGKADPTEGIHFTAVMGGGAGQFIDGINKTTVKKYGPDYRAEVVASCGYSRGEDALLGPARWKTDPQTLRGSFIAAVIRDDDWGIAVRHLLNVGIPINPNEETFELNSANFVNASDYMDASAKYVNGYHEKRKITMNGVSVGRDTDIVVQGAATWTPGDVDMSKKGGVVKIISTREYATHMPNVVIGIHKYNVSHRDVVEKVVTAFMQGGDQVLTFPKAFDRAMEIQQEINKVAGWTASDWKQYYRGVPATDPGSKQTFTLGGSKVNNLNDNLLLFGLLDGSTPETSRFHATYTLNGEIVTKMYPRLVPSIPPMDSAFDGSYLKVVAARIGSTSGKAEKHEFSTTDSIKTVIGKHEVAITFANGSATLTSVGRKQVEHLAQENQGNELLVQVNGYTDNVGSVESNTTLSQARADAIKTFLEQYDRNSYPVGRVDAVGHGPVNPTGPKTPNPNDRKVVIVIGQ